LEIEYAYMWAHISADGTFLALIFILAFRKTDKSFGQKLVEAGQSNNM